MPNGNLSPSERRTWFGSLGKSRLEDLRVGRETQDQPEGGLRAPVPCWDETGKQVCGLESGARWMAGRLVSLVGMTD